MEFTIFSGTYNSEPVIERLFKSITSQFYKDFEWIIIDDCSKDNTFSILQDFKNNHPEINIVLLRNELNQGVANSRRKAIMLAKGKYFVTWDHDDEQVPEQLQVFSNLWLKYKNENIGFIFVKVKNQHGKILGNPFPKDEYIVNYFDVHNKYLVGHLASGNVVEHHACVKTELYIKIFKYYEDRPELLNGKLPNGADIWSMIAYLGYKTIFINKPLRIYYSLETGRVTMSSVNKSDVAERIFNNKLLWVNFFNSKLPFLEIKWKLRNVFATVYYGLLAKISLFKILNKVNQYSNKFLIILLYFPAMLLARKSKK